ncbi:rRNA pseudouridine synthase [Candidatus Woesearchaeota archaeon]|nr:rRNA pseudouridine synthase [Candidatus Woesearchaeota archaeon]
MKLYLHQFLSKTGAFSSKEAIKKAVHGQEITVDGKIITNVAYQIKPSSTVIWKSKSLLMTPRIYLVINKPAGYLCSRMTKEDIRLGKKSVFELLNNQRIATTDVGRFVGRFLCGESPRSVATTTVNSGGTNQLPHQLYQSLVCVGRLDEDTSGLLIMTNDGEFVKQVTDPSSRIPKTYGVTLADRLTKQQQEALSKGVVISLEDNGKISRYRTLPANVTRVEDNVIHLTITEGKKREVRRMLEAVGNTVVELERIAIGNLRLNDVGLQRGEWREMAAKERGLFSQKKV